MNLHPLLRGLSVFVSVALSSALTGCWLNQNGTDSQQQNLQACAFSLKGGEEGTSAEVSQTVSWMPGVPTAQLGSAAQTFRLAQDTRFSTVTVRLQNALSGSATSSSARVRLVIAQELGGGPAAPLAQATVPVAAISTGRYVTVPFSMSGALQANTRYWAIVSAEDTATSNMQPISLRWLGTGTSNTDPDVMIFTSLYTAGTIALWNRLPGIGGNPQSLSLGVGCGS